MEKTFIFLITLLCTVIVVFLAVNLVLKVNKRNDVRLNKKIYIALFISIVNLIPYLVSINFKSMVSFLITTGAIFLSYFLFLDKKVLFSTIYTFTHLIASLLTEYITIVILNVSKVHLSLGEISNGSILSLCLIRVIPIFIYSLLNILVYSFTLNRTPHSRLYFSKQNKLAIIIQILLTIVLFCPNLLYFEFAHTLIPTYMLLINLISASILVFYGIYNILKQNELAIKDNELEIQTDYNKSLELALDKLRQFKHDYSNMLQSISGCIYLKDMDKLEKLFMDMKSDYSIINTTPVLESNFKSCPPLYGLLLKKVILAESSNINMNVSVLCDIDNERLCRLDLVKILGILIDNAIEAAKESEEKFVEIKFKKAQEFQEIVIKNSFESEIQLDQLFDKGYTTKENHTGLGLFEVLNIINKSKDISIKTEIDKNFMQILRIYQTVS